MIIDTKDYVTIGLSSAAFVVSAVNMLRSVQETRVARIRSCEQMRYAALAAISGASGTTTQAIISLEAIRFEAKTQRDPDSVAAADQHIAGLEQSLRALKKQEQEMPPASWSGQAKEVITMEKVLGACNAEAASASKEAIVVLRLVETIRQHLTALGIAKQSGVTAPST